MALQQYPKDSKTISVSDNIKYAYVRIRAKENKPTFLLLHGFPSSSYDWRHQITSLSSAGYGVLAPDLLGYGDTSKPEAKEEYAWKNQCSHIVKILDAEGLKEGKMVVAVGHDWGAGFLSPFLHYYQEYVNAAVFMEVPYSKPGRFDLDAVNARTEKEFGYPLFGYQYFFIEEDAAKTIEDNHDSFISLLYPSHHELWKTDVAPIGKVKEWVTSKKTSPTPSWLTEDEKTTHSKILLSGGYTGPLNWYKSAIADTDAVNRSSIPPGNEKVKVPVLLVVGEFDYSNRPESTYRSAERGRKAGYLPNVQVKVVKGAGHWVQLEKPEEVFEILDGFVKGLGESHAAKL